MAEEFLTEENIKAFRFLGFIKVRYKSGNWISFNDLLDYALKLKAELEGKDRVIDELKNSHETNKNAVPLSLKEKLRFQQGGAS